VTGSRALDFAGQIQGGLVLLAAAAHLRWQEVGWLVAGRPRISDNKAGFLSLFKLASGRGAGKVLRIAFAGIPRWKTMARLSSAGSANKRPCLNLLHILLLLLLLLGHGGDGEQWRIWEAGEDVGPWDVGGATVWSPPEAAFLRVDYTASLAAVIFGQNGGPYSTSTAEALLGTSRRSPAASR